MCYEITQICISHMHSMDDEQQWHVQQLSRHCRICGQRLQKERSRSSSYACIEKQEDLEMTFGIYTGVDETLYPSHFCNSCYAKTKRSRESTAKGEPYNPAISVFVWTPHSSPDCTVRKNEHLWFSSKNHMYIRIMSIGMHTLQNPYVRRAC